jgi:hypothetical protein
MGGACSAYVEGREVCRVLVRKPEGKRPKRRWDDNIKADLSGSGMTGNGHL